MVHRQQLCQQTEPSMQSFTHAYPATLNDDDAGFKTKGRVYAHEVYTFINSEPYTPTNRLQMWVYGGRHITTLTEAG